MPLSTSPGLQSEMERSSSTSACLDDLEMGRQKTSVALPFSAEALIDGKKSCQENLTGESMREEWMKRPLATMPPTNLIPDFRCLPLPQWYLQASCALAALLPADLQRMLSHLPPVLFPPQAPGNLSLPQFHLEQNASSSGISTSSSNPQESETAASL